MPVRSAKLGYVRRTGVDRGPVRVKLKLALPGFVAAAQARAEAERRAFLFRDTEAGAPAPPAAATSAWELLLAYARAHPEDPKSAEALYWLVRIGRWGHSGDRIGYRAFRLLHTRHPSSPWTEKSPFYYD